RISSSAASACGRRRSRPISRRGVQRWLGRRIPEGTKRYAESSRRSTGNVSEPRSAWPLVVPNAGCARKAGSPSASITTKLASRELDRSRKVRLGWQPRVGGKAKRLRKTQRSYGQRIYSLPTE